MQQQDDFEREIEIDVGPSLSQRGSQKLNQSLNDSRFQPDQHDLGYIKFKTEQRSLLEQKVQIKKRIESMKREFDFIYKMDAQDVKYVLAKKKEHAALLIQRNFRRVKQQKAYREQQRRGIQQKDLEPELTEEDLKRIDENKAFLENRKEFHQKKRPDEYYRKIPEDQKQKLLEKFKAAQISWGMKAKEHKHDRLRKYDEYHEKANRFNTEYRNIDKIRAQGHDDITSTEIMMHFLVDLNPDERTEAAKPLPITESKVEKLDHEQAAAVKGAQRLNQIRVWTDVADNFDHEDQTRVSRNHKERLAR